MLVLRELANAKLQLVLVDFAVESWQHAGQVLNEITLRLTQVIGDLESGNNGTVQIHAVRLHVWSFETIISLGTRFSRS